ncbi:MAG TPA: type II toxin-antitoxin system VapC family toxin [Chloroflexota bacterium]|nr:type II toxin-antitoxin system VapC family toxin [Chloroflexota bacterium]
MLEISTSDFLLDTNVLSEWVKPLPDAGVVEWLEEVDEDRVRLSVASFAEVRHGIERMSPGSRRERLAIWLHDELPARFEGRLLDIDRAVAQWWGILMADARRAGRGLSVMDGFFAATAKHYDLTLVTRNVRDFQSAGIALLNPWRTP